MRNNTKKGFTLVELLVVIAILAILATVSVVGYTSFIKSAAVSNDENIAAQLNNFMNAIKADHTSEFYNQEVTPENARDFVYEALVLGGLDGQLKPDAADYGYHFYYDLKKDKIVVLDNAIDDGALLKNMLAGLGVLAVNYDILDNPATCFTKQDAEFTKYNGIRYVFLDNDGSELAELINLFNNVNSAEDFARLQELATKALFDGKTITTFDRLINKSIFVGSSGSYMTATGEKTLFFGKTMSSNKYVGTTLVNAFEVPTTLPMHVPSSIKFFTSNSLNFATSTYDANAETHTTVLHFDLTLSELAQRVDPNFTNVVFTLADGKQYACVDNQIVCLDGSNVTSSVEPKNPVTGFDFEVVDDSDYLFNNVVKEGDNVVYISWDNFATGTTFNLTATKFVGDKTNDYGAVSNAKVVWDVHTDSKEYLALVDANGTFKFTGTIPAIVDGVCVVKVEAKDEIGGATETFEIRIVRVTNEQTITVDGKPVNSTSVNTLVYSGAGKKYDVSATANFTYSDVITNGNIKGGAEFKVVPASANLTYDNNQITVVPSEGTTNETLKFYYGNYEFISKDLVLYDAANLPFAVKSDYADFVVAHNSDLKASDFFVKTSNWEPLGTITLIVSTTASNDDITAEIADDTLLRPTYVSSNKVSGMDTAFQFLQAQSTEVTFYLVHEYNGGVTRVSPDFTVHVVEGKNVRTIADLENGVNNVLLTNLKADANYTGFTLKDKILYGNANTIDLRAFDETKTGIEALITLDNATLYNVNVIGEVYKSTNLNFQDPTTKAYGASLVKATNGSKIEGSYLANTRSPLITTGTVTVHNSTIFGGNYANIDVRSGTLTLTGNVTTINQITTETPDTVGFGIAVDLFAPAETKVDISGANLKQYNYITEADASKLPSIYMDYTIEDVTILVGDEIRKMFANETKYGSYIYTDTNNNNTKYFNAGIVFLNGAEVESYRKNWKGEWVSGGVDAILGFIGVDIVNSNGGVVALGSNNYGGTTITVQKGPTEVNVIITTYKVTIYANGYFWTPMPDASNNNGNFNNNASAYLPSNYLPAN